MADKKISELDALAAADIADDDLVVVVDISATTTKKMVFGDLVKAMNAPLTTTGTSASTFTVDVGAVGRKTVAKLTAQDVDLTLANPTGTPQDSQQLEFQIKDNGGAQVIDYGSEFVGSSDLALPDTTVVGKVLVMLFQRGIVSSKWVLLAAINI